MADSHPSGAQCLCQGVLVQCCVAHRYPPGDSVPIKFCVTYVMLLRWNGRCLMSYVIAVRQ